MNQQNQPVEEPESSEEPFDYTHVDSIARIALYDDLLSAPHVTEIQPAPTGEFIETLATNVYQQSQQAGGTIPYTVIREVSENFIHARFQEATVSILDHGCTIRFADQGPGIACKDRAQLPGFTSAIEPMKSYIRGVGSGLPIVKEYLDFTHGTISIEDNLGTGSVVTISANGSNPKLPKELELNHEEESGEAEPVQAAPRYHISGEDAQAAQTRYAQPAAWPAGQNAYAPAYAAQPPAQPYAQPASQYAPAQAALQQGYAQSYAPAVQPQYAGGQPVQAAPYQPQPQYAYQQPQPAQPPFPTAPSAAMLSQREKDFLNVFLNEGPLGVTDLTRLTGVAQSSVYNVLKTLEEAGMVKKMGDKKRVLTTLGAQVAQQL